MRSGEETELQIWLNFASFFFFLIWCIVLSCIVHVCMNVCIPGITGILMSAAGLPVCLTRPPKLVLHPPPVSKSDIKPIPGLGHCCRKTSKKQARKGMAQHIHINKFQIHSYYNLLFNYKLIVFGVFFRFDEIVSCFGSLSSR